MMLNPNLDPFGPAPVGTSLHKDYFQLTRSAWNNFVEQPHSTELVLRHIMLNGDCISYLASSIRESKAKPQKLSLTFSTVHESVHLDDLTELFQTSSIQMLKCHGMCSGIFARGRVIVPILKSVGSSNHSNIRELNIGFVDLWIDPEHLVPSYEHHQVVSSEILNDPFYIRDTLINCPISSLELFVCNLNIGTSRVLGEGMRGHRFLKKIVLNACSIDTEMLDSMISYGLGFSNPKCLVHLECLELPRNELDHLALPILGDFIQSQPHLRHLDLSENNLFRHAYHRTPAALHAFCQSVAKSSLQSLVLRRVQLVNQAAKSLFQSLEGSSTTLKELYLEANPIQDGEWLNSIPKINCLTHLSVEPVGGLSPARAVETFGRNTQLKWLHLGGAPKNAYYMMKRNQFLEEAIDHHHNHNLPVHLWPDAISKIAHSRTGMNLEAIYEFVQQTCTELTPCNKANSSTVPLAQLCTMNRRRRSPSIEFECE